MPSCLEQARQVGAIPMKKTDQALIRHLNRDEIRALLDAPDPSSTSGTARSRDAAPGIRRGVAGLGAGRAQIGSDRAGNGTLCPRHGKRAPRAHPASVEGNGVRHSSVAKGPSAGAATPSCS